MRPARGAYFNHAGPPGMGLHSSCYGSRASGLRRFATAESWDEVTPRRGMEVLLKGLGH